MKYCMLDFDGVILRNHLIHPVVQHKCIKFVSKKLQIPYKQAVHVNKELYEAGGHTVTSLQMLGYSCSVKEFNEYVYNDIDYKIFEKVNKTHKNDITSLRRILQKCKDQSIQPFVFSNAPDSYCYQILEYMAFDPETQQTCPLISSLSSTYTLTQEYLKPFYSAYIAIEEALGGKEAEFILVDDKLSNLLAVQDQMNWKKILMAPESFSQSVRNKLTIVSTLDEVAESLNE